MTQKVSPFNLSRRRFAMTLTACSLAVFPGTVLHARGGGSDVARERTERAARRQDDGHSQQQFLKMSRTKLFENSQASDARVHGFSPEMSAHLFAMGVANLPRTKALVQRLQTVRQVVKRRNILNGELEFARQDLKDFWGLPSQKSKRKIYLDGVSRWVANPQEGLA